MLPWLMERGEVPLAEVARHFRMPPEQVVADLELAAMCGLPPFVDEMIDVFIDDDTVVVGVPRLFTRPLRLTAPEGFALVAAGRAAMQLPGADVGRPARAGAAEAGRRARRRRRRRRHPDDPGDGGVDRRRHRRRPRRRAAARRVLDAVARRGDGAHDHAATGLQRPRRVVRRGRRRALGRAAHVPHRPARVDRAHRRARPGAGRRRSSIRPDRRSGSPTAACRASCCG